MNKNRSQGMAMISLVFALIITAIIAVIVLRMYTGAGGKGSAINAQTPIDRAKTLQCNMLLKKMNDAVRLYQMENNNLPSSLSDIRELSSSELYCPVTGKAYEYDSETGRVTCPGHQ